MSMVTAQQIHSRNWMTCPRCDGGKVFTAKDRRQGSQCTYCDDKGEVPKRRPARVTPAHLGRD